VLLAGLAVFAWLASVAARSVAGYLYIKQQSHGWEGRLMAYDARLGTRAVPGGRGAEILGGVATPVRFDRDGFRVPFSDRGGAGVDRPLVAAVGDSFTFGSGVRAEEAFPWLVADALGGRVLNAGLPGYGLAEMLPAARDILSEHRPDVLLVQASSWLPSRAKRKFRSSRFATIPVPHFVRTADPRRPAWRPPVFRPKVFDLPVASYRSSPARLPEWASFLVRVGVPLYAHDDPRLARHAVRRALRLNPRAARADTIAAHVYPEILRMCREAGTRMVVVVLEAAGKHNQPQSEFVLPPDVPVVDTKPGLYARLPDRSEAAWLRAYGHWHGDPPVFTDEHPNARAHAIIAEQVVRALGGSARSSEGRDGGGGWNRTTDLGIMRPSL
jgi:hypothetical protein